ncbi:Putative PhzC/PhzF-like epimerase [Ignavibacterium album JCM 16511]|uniref:Putative PhzC/PhzF-like epimerase n=1 Tax=Ignavibacterium album (strain DSM 19864 / JCM 16511 / NBRC 101810 / Mat9-16) TaxID=945713 RepID=I0AM77_IGNAJ|nr:PhzF family phenazine biosynthesis protein [Ignavibacterium album]AFH50084.1 Putative PhzC/PhzF-like epimerase [Ignavibacterium album JCM 16511]
MPKLIEIFQIDAFTAEPFTGNSAAVVLNDFLSENEMKSIAAEMNLSETAFLSHSNEAGFNLRWFTPKNEVNLCGHATIASIHFLFEKNLIEENSHITFKTKSGIINAGISANKYWMQLPKISFEKITAELTDIFSAFGINSSQVNREIFVGTNKYLFIGVDNLQTLFNLEIDFNKLSKIISSQNKFCDIAIYTLQTLEDDSLAHLRFFAPAEGIFEDPVTGSAAGPLLLLLYQQNLIKNFSDDRIYKMEQGDILNRKGRIGVSYNHKSDVLKIHGNAVTILKGNLII